jgi:hypothetical protein
LPRPNLSSREFFLRHSRDPQTFGLRPLTYSFYELDRPGFEPLKIRSMLSTHEIALLYAIAAEWHEHGAIVDLGPLLGASTWALAKGLAKAGKSEPSVIHSFDLWSTAGTYDAYLSEMPRGGAGSVLGQWTRAVAPWLDSCEPHQGDFLTWEWDGRDIGVLFVDIAKSWDLSDHVVRTMFPCLKPGALLVQQDYIHWNEYWIHIEMARFRPYFRHCQFLRGATSFYECVATPPADLCATPASSLPYDLQIELLDGERALQPESIQEVMKVAAAKHAIENEDFGRASVLLDSVDVTPRTDNPLIEVSGIATSNLKAARTLLERAWPDSAANPST